jgi:hypothetical protein
MPSVRTRIPLERVVSAISPGRREPGGAVNEDKSVEEGVE